LVLNKKLNIIFLILYLKNSFLYYKMSIKLTLTKIKNSTHILHKDSGLVLRSQKEKVVIGKFKNGEIIPLNRDDIGVCEKWNFKYDEELIEDLETEGEDEGDDDAGEPEGEDDAGEAEEEAEGEDDTREAEGEDDTGEVEGHDEAGGEDDVVDNDSGEVEVEVEDGHDIGRAEDGTPKVFDSHTVVNQENKSVYIRDITTSFANELYRTFDSIQQKYIQEISDLQNKVIVLSKEIDSLNDKFATEKTEHEHTTIEFNKLKAKFEGIKNLFS
jgi:hypothetical protein